MQTARNTAIDAATDAERQLHALITTAPSEVAERFRGLKTTAVIAELTRPRRKPVGSFEATMTTLAKRVVALRDGADRHKETIGELAAKTAPALLELCGVGPIIAAKVIFSWGQPGRLRNDVAFAGLAGAALIPASSGVTSKHRLNRFGDRKLNSAIHIIAITRLRSEWQLSRSQALPPAGPVTRRRRTETDTESHASSDVPQYSDPTHLR